MSFVVNSFVAGVGQNLPVYTTAGRPSAATVGIGFSYFDTTLNYVVTSDGTNWRNGAGTIV